MNGWRTILSWELDKLPFHPGDRVRMIDPNEDARNYETSNQRFVVPIGGLGTVTAYPSTRMLWEGVAAEDYVEVDWDGFIKASDIYPNAHLTGWIAEIESVEPA